MAIRDFLTRKIEDFMKALTTLVHYKNSLQWEKALDFIQENRDEALWQAMLDGDALNDKDQRDAVEFQLKLAAHEIEIVKMTNSLRSKRFEETQKLLNDFLLANQDTYYMELEEMKLKLA